MNIRPGRSRVRRKRDGVILPSEPTTLPSAPPPPSQELKDSYHYIVIGAGSAGCVVASRLAEDPVDVLLLEAGGKDDDPRIHNPARFEELQALPGKPSAVDWGYLVDVSKEKGLTPDIRGPFVLWTRGKVLGGSSAINASLYVRGNRRDFDYWAELGNKGWAFDDILPFFKKSEGNRREKISRQFHGTDGPLMVTDIPRPNPSSVAFIEAAEQAGYDRNSDFNDREQVGGAGFYQVTINEDGTRCSAAVAFLSDAALSRTGARDRLTIATGVEVTRIVLEDKQAVAVEFVDRSGSNRSIRARREIIVSCGTTNSPKLLMLSGIGPADRLRELGIEVVQDLPGMGRNLQDHPIAPVLYFYKEGKQSEPASAGGVEGGLFLTTRKGSDPDWPDLQFHFTHKILGRPGSPEADVGYMIVPTLVRPQSRGEIYPKSTNPSDPPEIRANYLTEEADIKTLIAGIKIAREIGMQPALEAFRAGEALPGPGCITDAQIEKFIRAAAAGLYHPVGTCRMGSDLRAPTTPDDGKRGAVVDSRLRVHGIRNLRVIDASIMPIITAANTNAATIMIAEKGAQLIKEDAAQGKPKGKKTYTVENTAQAFLHLLNDLGVKQIFGTPGSDVTALLDAFSKFNIRGEDTPRLLAVPHEACAISMAHAFYLATGEPPVALVHSTVGTANTMCGLINASRSHIPLVLLAGRTSITEKGHKGSRDLVIQWAQESFDQGAMVREFVKWDYELRTFDQLETVVRRAFSIAMTEPRGPVYLTLPRELLSEAHSEFVIERTDRDSTPVAMTVADPAVIHEIATAIIEASHPLIITRSFARRPEAVSVLTDLAESCAAPVIEYQVPEFMNFPSDHDLHFGFQYTNPINPGTQNGDRITTDALREADVILAIDCPMPWSISQQEVNYDAVVVHIGTDPIHSRYPVWGFPAHYGLPGDSVETVRQLTAAVKRQTSADDSRFQRRREDLGRQHHRQREAWNDTVWKSGAKEKIDFVWLSHCIGEVTKDDREIVVIQEYDLQLSFTRFTRPGSYYGFSPSGGLGFGVGGALGLKMGLPDKTIISVIGDGTYFLGPSGAAHIVSAMHNLPVLWVVCNNSGWSYLALETMFVEESRPGRFPMLAFPRPSYVNSKGPWPAFETMVNAFGGEGRSVSEPQDLKQALENGIGFVRSNNRQYLINVECDPSPL